MIVVVDSAMTAYQFGSRTQELMRKRMDRNNATVTLMKLCTCAVVTGGHRVPHAACPVHGETLENAE